MWNVLLWKVLWLIPTATDIVKKILHGRRYDEPVLIYSGFFGITILLVIFLWCIVMELKQIYCI